MMTLYQRLRPHNLFGQLVPVFDSPWEEKNIYLVNFPVFQFVPIASSPVSGHREGKSSPIFFTLPPFMCVL